MLLAAAIASPSPDATDAEAHPTDVAVVAGARAAGLGYAVGERQAESRFDPVQGFHATLADGRLSLKGAVEVLAERCSHVRINGRDQPPEHRNLAALSREGGTALDAPLRVDIIRRGIATGVPSYGAYALASRIVGPTAARSVAYLSIVTTQLAQTVDLGQAEGRLTAPVLAAVAGSLGVVGTTLTVPGLRDFLGLAPLTLPGVLVAGGASLLAVALGRGLPVERWLCASTDPRQHAVLASAPAHP